MSVINQMLRDLDQRQSQDLNSGSGLALGDAMDRHTRAVESGDTRPAKNSTVGARAWLFVSVVLLAVILLGLSGVINLDSALRGRSTLPAPVASGQKLVPPPVVTPSVGASEVQVSVALAPAVLEKPLVEAPRQVMPLKMDEVLRKLPSRAPDEMQPTQGPVQPATVAARASRAHTDVLVQTPSSPVRPGAVALEVVAQAQNLWNAGSTGPALDLLREALSVLERDDYTSAATSQRAALPAVVRELARMEIAQGHVRAALELLERLEVKLAEHADLWALRGHAAQRLGRHSESSAAYLRALQLRPQEPRWMVAAAVSLAAQGQTDAAARLAASAQASGALTTEVATYLRQLGVTLQAP